MSDRWSETLSDYLDGDLATAECRTLERHLESCEDCRTTLAELRRVKAYALALVDPPAPDDLWAGIASRIGTAGSTSAPSSPRILELPARGPSHVLRLALAAGFAMLLVTAGALWTAWQATHARAPREVASLDSALDGTVQLASFDAVRVEGEIATLKQALERGRGKLDPRTVAVLEKNLTVIQRATEDAKLALEKDPANKDLQRYFAATVGSKMNLMRRAAAQAGV
jgi:hypothetical protein